MKRLLTRLLVICPVFQLVLPVQAAGRVGEAEVRAGANGNACFTIAMDEERRGGGPEFQSVKVSAPGGTVMWKMAMPRERTFPLNASMCIPYGGRVPALPQTAAAPLAEGVVYQVQIDTRQTGNRPTHYLARFCLVREGRGVARVHRIGASGQSERAVPTCPAPGA
ncbi:hypothetical protein G4G28_18770 [Massilia sp. Dwa41.01b]|uniref:hypothetical protein n=1 Tax=unclassified Massilia TaxID=2609279 RepID=UPI001601E564|nr:MULTISPECIES: hypothetical protein [unclassified Massilia]QNA90027.1 hypothetical protein G4G28_18770 [Massilia sp. Dwa41.01b]QNB00917.1 hypothetical protein G4G31_22370 [Massilia sp. Se16.2.3]